jgi:hypothetical protein
VSRPNDPDSLSSISDISFSFVPASNFFQTEKFNPDVDFLASNDTQNVAHALAYTTGEQEKRSTGAYTFDIKDQYSSCDTEIIYAGQKRKDRDNDDYVPAFKRLRSIIPCSEKNLGTADSNFKSTTSDDICYIERKPTADQKSWLQNQNTLHEEDVISLAIRGNADRQDGKTAQVLATIHDESSQQLHENSNKKTSLDHLEKLLIKRDSGYHECDQHPNEVKASSESPDGIDRSLRTPSPPSRHKVIQPSTLELRTICTVEDLFEELEEDHIKEDVHKDYYTDEDDGRELVFVQ